MQISLTWRIVSVLVLGTVGAGAWTLGRGVDPGSGPSSRGAGLPEWVAPEPGLTIDNGPPAGWSHLVIKSIPRLATGDVATLPASATSSLFRTAILADVGPSGGAGPVFVLRRVGMCLCLTDRGHDRVVTTASLETLGIALGTVPRIVLDRAERELAQGRIVARTSTFALLRIPTNLASGGEHRRIVLGYGLLVDPETGSLRAGVAPIDEPARELILLPPNLVFDCGLDVAANRIFGRLAVSWSFAMGSLPPGRAFPSPKGWPSGVGDAPLSEEEATSLERDLRAALN